VTGRRRIAALAAAIILPITAGGALAARLLQPTTPRSTPVTVASADPTGCAPIDPYQYTQCLETALGELAEQDPQAAIAAYNAAADAVDRVREVCHGLFHNIGNGAVASGQAPWDLLMLGTSECNWGYVHGVVEAYFGDDAAAAIREAATLCTPPTGLAGEEQYIRSVAGNCVHGTGHALYLATRDPIVAARGCRDAFTNDSSWLDCVDGMIMEFGGSTEALAGQHAGLCEEIAEGAKSKCYANISLTWYYQMDRSYDAVLARCEQAPGDDLIGVCIRGASNLFATMEGFEVDTFRPVCRQYQDRTRREACLYGVATSGAQGVHIGALDAAVFERWLDEEVDPAARAAFDAEIARARAGFGAAAS
jgi:hypothetical protein